MVLISELQRGKLDGSHDEKFHGKLFYLVVKMVSGNVDAQMYRLSDNRG